jgi:hypothetical protein
VRAPPPRPQLHLTRLAQATKLRRQQPPLSILSVGYTNTASGCPPVAPARQRKRKAITSDPQPGMPGRCGVQLEPCHDVAAATRSPPTLPDKRLLVPSERRTCRLVSHRNTHASGDAPRKPRRVSPAPATSHELPPKKSNIGVSSRCIERVATPVAEQLLIARRRRPSSAGPRILRVETRSLRSPASLGGLDVNADTNRRVCNRRLDTTVHPHDVGTDDVAITAPARASHETLGVR